MKTLAVFLLCAAVSFSQTAGKPQKPSAGSTRKSSGTSKPSASGTDHFNAVCANSATVRCVDFEEPVSRSPFGDPGQDKDDDGRGGFTNGEVDQANAASGSGSFHFTIPAFAGPDTSGSVHLNFSSDLSTSFGEGQEFYVQWRQKMDDNYLNNAYLVGGNCPVADGNARVAIADCPRNTINGGMKQVIIGPQDTSSAESSFGKHYSCETPHLVITMGGYRQIPIMYHSCGPYEPFNPAYVRQGTSIPSYLMQSAVPCAYTAVLGKPAPDPCVKYVANEWMTVQVHVKVGHWYTSSDYNTRRDSTVEMWLAREDQPSVLVQSMSYYSLRNNAVDKNKNQPGAPYNYGKLWLLPYNTGRDRNAGPYPEAHIWYDSVVISRTRVPDPGLSLQPPTNLSLDSSSYPVTTLSWTPNADVAGGFSETGYEIQRCTGQIGDCIAESLAKASWSTISSVPAGVTTYQDSSAEATKIYTYRVRATDGSISSAFTNVVVTAPVPPYDLQAVPDSEGGIRLTWRDNSDNESQFTIERCEGVFQYYRANGTAGQAYYSQKCLNRPFEDGGKEDKSFAEIDHVAGSEGIGGEVTYVDKRVTRGKSYSYRVRALNKAGAMRFWDSQIMGHSNNANATLEDPPAEEQLENGKNGRTRTGTVKR